MAATKGLTREEAIKELAYITKQTVFNNELKKACRKNKNLMPANFNGWNDTPTNEMIQFVKKFVEENGQFLKESHKRRYIAESGAIFYGSWSIAINTYLNNDIKDLQKYIAMLSLNEKKEDQDAIEGAKISRENGRLNIDFGGRVDDDTYKVLRSNGFLYSPKFSHFTRQLTPNAEHSLLKVIKQLKEVNA